MQWQSGILLNGVIGRHVNLLTLCSGSAHSGSIKEGSSCQNEM